MWQLEELECSQAAKEILGLKTQFAVDLPWILVATLSSKIAQSICGTNNDDNNNSYMCCMLCSRYLNID